MRINPVSLDAPSSCNWLTSIHRYSRNKPINPFRDIVSLQTRNTVQAERTEFTPVSNYLLLMYPHDKLRQFVHEVVGVKYDDSSDVKMHKIAKWVTRNIKYITDEENWGVSEFWAPPIFTLAKRGEDCDGQSLLIMSLALNAGVPESRLRWYGGYVNAGRGAPSGGHAWTAYRRESDNQWVAVDSCYFPDSNIGGLKPMKDDMKYREDYFFMTVNETTVTPGTNRVRDPEGYTSMGAMKNALLISQLVDLLA